MNQRSLPARLFLELGDSYLVAVSDEIRNEVKDVLNRPKLRAKFPELTDKRVAELLAVLDSGLEVELEQIPPISRDPKDDIFLATASASSADYLVSEDNDLLVLKQYQNTQIINALDFLTILTKKSGYEE